MVTKIEKAENNPSKIPNPAQRYRQAAQWSSSNSGFSRLGPGYSSASSQWELR